MRDRRAQLVLADRLELSRDPVELRSAASRSPAICSIPAGKSARAASAERHSVLLEDRAAAGVEDRASAARRPSRAGTPSMPRIDAWTQRTPWACSSICAAARSPPRRHRPVAEAGAEPELDLGRLTLLTGGLAWTIASSSAAASSPKRQTRRPTSLRSRHARARPSRPPPPRRAARPGLSDRRSYGSARRVGLRRTTPARPRPAPPGARHRPRGHLERPLERALRLGELAELDEDAADAVSSSAWSATPIRERVPDALEQVQRRRKVAAIEARDLPADASRSAHARARPPRPRSPDRARCGSRTPARGGSR